jgi:hypothetical protein
MNFSSSLRHDYVFEETCKSLLIRIHAATLTARTFRTLMAITAAFDLEVRQYHDDAVNAFTNSVLDKVVYCKCPEGFEQAGMCLLL